MPSLGELYRMMKTYAHDALPGGGLNAELKPVADRVRYISGAMDPKSPISNDLQNWHQRTQRGLADQLAGRQTPAAEQAYQTMMQMAGVAPIGMFIGKGAKTWDAVSMGKAQQMAQEGADPRAIWKETGTWQGPDGAWRQEIPDNAAKTMLDDAGYFGVKQKYGPLSEAVDHSGLYASYPEMKSLESSITQGSRANFGDGYIPESGAFKTGLTGSHLVASGPDAKSTTLHELQHVIQGSEGWARGGSPETALKDYLSLLGADPKTYTQRELASIQGNAFKDYQRLAGEAEARATQARMSMDAAQRRNVFPADSYDVPLSSLIIRK